VISTPAAADVDVIVVGAGPVGLSTALQLGRAGASVRVLERRPTHSHLPRAHVVNSRSMEIFRGWGITGGLRADALPSEMARAFAWVTSMRGKEFARIENIADEILDRHTPELLCSCPQDRVEYRLREAIASLPSVSVDLGHQVVGYQELRDGAAVRVHRADGSAEQVRARYVVAADGGRSPLRAMAGVEAVTMTSVRRMLSIYFHAELSQYTRRRPFILWFVHNEQTQGITITVDGIDRWVYSREVDLDATVGQFSDEYCLELVRAAVGVPDLEPDIRARQVWDQDMAVARAFRVGPLFFAGDSAHRFPPTGGFGMNTGLQDSHNLGWKMALVLSGLADESLLDTYESERRPVAMINARQSMVNAEQLVEGDAMLNRPDTLRLLTLPEGAELRAGLAAGIRRHSTMFHALGQMFGYAYEGPGIIDDGSPPLPPTIETYVPTARPGARAPHVWLGDGDGRRVTTVDLVADGFTILADTTAEPWRTAATAATATFCVGVKTFAIAPTAPGELVDVGDPGTWRETYQLEESGAVLVRPDGHVLARWRALPDDPAHEVASALSALLRATATQPERVGS
jgi:putative polyketide hydroxylase